LKSPSETVTVQAVYDAAANAVVFWPDGAAVRDVLGAAANVFVCGSLQDPAKMRGLLRRHAPFAPAFAPGYTCERHEVNGRPVQFMLPAADATKSSLPGVVWLDLAAADLQAIDAFELGDGLRRKITVTVNVGRRPVTATTYVKK
jgi:hypothetical protein